MSLNKTCKYCPDCDLVIAKKQELEPLIQTFVQMHNPQHVENDYLVLGTIDKKLWAKGKHTPLDNSEIFNNLFVFEEVLNFILV